MSFPLLELFRAGVLSELDYQFAKTLSDMGPGTARQSTGQDGAGDLVTSALALVSRQTRAGHVCADLSAFAGTPIVDESGEPVAGSPSWPPLEPWRASLEQSSLVSRGAEYTPLVLGSEARLYLYRYWEHERRVAELLNERVGLHSDRLDTKLLASGLERLFGPPQEPNSQRDAALLTLAQRFTTIVGGPGTGKTSTVAGILALLTEQTLARERRSLSCLLLAPTGKAAARLVESIRKAKARLECSEAVRQAIVEEASTIHRALGRRRDSNTRFHHDREHPLVADLVLVDEASMVDVALMRRLLEAVPAGARLILLGDRHQLASVEAGSVLGDICTNAEHPGYVRELVERVRDLSGSSLLVRPNAKHSVIDSVTELTKSFRFGATSGIARFAAAVNQGNATLACELLGGAGKSDLGLRAAPDTNALLGRLETEALHQFRWLAELGDPASALGQLDKFRILCAHRHGPLGVGEVNQRIETALERAGLLYRTGEWYPGRPILITSNDHHLQLFNGDVGIILRDENGALRAFFNTGQGPPRALSPARLPAHETVFAMSIHKSQGSEFDEVGIVLPRPNSPLLTRELLYTAVTRARERAVLYGDLESVRVGSQRPVARASGLGGLLHRFESRG